MGLEEIYIFLIWVLSAYKLYLSHKIGCGHLLTKKVSLDMEEKRWKGQTQHLEIRLRKMNQQRRNSQ